MAAIKVHAFVGSNAGTESCDFRGDKFIGHEQGDEHRTIFEKDPATEAEIAAVLEYGPKLNALLDTLTPSEGFGIEGGLRIGVWDE